jgi:tRNA pseudouridine38-40 synthase
VLVATVRADAFCHSMVRSLVGSVVPVGEGRRGTDWPRGLQAQAVRAPEVRVMPAHGLSLEEVVYPGEADLAVRAVATRARRERS